MAVPSPLCARFNRTRRLTRHSRFDAKGFTPKQLAAIDGVMGEARVLLGSDPAALSLPAQLSRRLGLPPGITYGVAMREVAARGAPGLAGRFTAGVLALRQDPRVQGVELQAGQQREPCSAG